MPCFPTETWLILKCQFAYNIEHFPIVDFFFTNYIVHTSLIFCVREKMSCCLPLNRI